MNPLDLLGYPLYLAFIFLPGIGIGEALGVWREGSALTERVAYSFGLGLCADTAVVLVRTSGLLPGLSGLDVWTLCGTILVGLGLIAASLVKRNRFSWWIRPDVLDWAMLAIVVVLALMVGLYLQTYPIFPAYPSGDFPFHVQVAENLVRGSQTSVPSGIFYYGVHFLLASALVLFGGFPLQTVRVAMAILTVLSPLIFYLVALRLSGSRGAGVLAAMVYTFSGAIWYGMVFDGGLYPNFFGVLAALFLIAVLVEVNPARWSVSGVIVLSMATLTAYFSHDSTVTILPIVLSLPLMRYLSTRSFPRTISEASILVVAPGAIGLLVRPDLLSRLLATEQSVATLSGSTAISLQLSNVPVLGYMALEVADDLGFVLLSILAGVFLWKMITSRKWMLSPLVIWFVTLLVLAPLSISAWRFSLEALVPLTLMASAGVFLLLPRLVKRADWRLQSSEYGKTGLLLFLILIPMIGGSWGVRMTQDAMAGASAVPQTQTSINASISWLGFNTPQNSSYLSVSEWRFTYTSLFLSRNTTVLSLSPTNAIEYTLSHSVRYILVTNIVTWPSSGLEGVPWNGFPDHSTSNLSLVYRNPDVRIFLLNDSQT